jgi:hypothetical protein
LTLVVYGWCEFVGKWPFRVTLKNIISGHHGRIIKGAAAPWVKPDGRMVWTRIRERNGACRVVHVHGVGRGGKTLEMKWQGHG